MDQTQTETFVNQSVRIILKRTPNPEELRTWCSLLRNTSPTELLLHLEALEIGPTPRIQTHWPHGHYYSPVVDPDDSVRQYWEEEQKLAPHQINGIDLDIERMISFWMENSQYLLANPFPDHLDGRSRFHNVNGSFPGGDAVFVGAIMRTYLPRKIIEIGSGNSTGCMLDWAERLNLANLKITCIEPDPARLKKVLKPNDHVEIIQKLVQDVDFSVFSELQANDILFIDSTHVLKTASDVHYELFTILPALADGVIVHFHDCAYPFEYPKEAVFDMNFSWNEAYAVRAFLMYNQKFKVLFWNSMFHRFCSPEMREAFGTLSQNPGGGLWLIKVA